ncbi:hypothetical protein P8C59_008734 [Phyllachora maydis]|uniref:2-dehydropantoate 2-reductase n=1 Tax=Phyllachora maydis TaxID=1825666 RepID=A0AAD9MEW4_9PEZI|nr:hypothetical protein P8C59_008734 [Phyllachora maydis]
MGGPADRYSSRPVHIVFVGAGAVGCFYASRLHHPRHDVHTTLIARSNFKVLADHGVRLETHAFGDYTFRPHAVFPSVTAAAAAGSSAGAHTWDLIVVTTKALPDQADDSALIAPLLGPRSCIVLIQNGVGVEEPYRSRFPDTPIVSAAGSDAANQLADWWSRLGGLRDAVVLDEVGLQTVRWHKLCINAAMNPSAVLSGGRGNAAMARDPELRAHLGGVMAEIWAAAPRLLGRPFPEDLADPDRILQSSERNTAGKPSMLLDWEAGRPLELEVILGNPVRIARAKGVELPRMQTLYALLKSAQAMREHARTAAKGKL